MNIKNYTMSPKQEYLLDVIIKDIKGYYSEIKSVLNILFIMILAGHTVLTAIVYVIIGISLFYNPQGKELPFNIWFLHIGVIAYFIYFVIDWYKSVKEKMIRAERTNAF